MSQMDAPNRPDSSDNDRYEQACDQAIAMCDGNMRSAIKALLLVNEYLEMELQQLQGEIAAETVDVPEIGLGKPAKSAA